MTDRDAVVAGYRHTPPDCLGVHGRGSDLSGGMRRHRPERAQLARRVGDAQQRGQRHRQVHGPGQTRRPAQTGELLNSTETSQPPRPTQGARA